MTTACATTPETQETTAAIGDLTSKTGLGTLTYASTGYANPHAVTSAGGSTYGYDENGDLTFRASDAFAWDFKNRLLSAYVNGATSTFAYDPEATRVQMTASGTSTDYASDWYSSSAGKPIKHLFADGILIATIEGSTSTAVVRFIHTDHLTGSSVVTSATGTIVETTDYDPYGSIRLDDKTGAYSESRKFANLIHDDSTGLNYAGSRYYDGGLGRFLSEDPAFLAVGDSQKLKQTTKIDLQEYLASPQHLNSYSYAFNSPLVFVDEDGKFAVGTFGVGVLQMGKAALGFTSAVSQAILAGVTLAAGQPQASGILATSSLGNLDGAMTDFTNAPANLAGAAYDLEPVKILEQGPYREWSTQMMGDTKMLDTVTIGGDVLSFGLKDAPEYLSKAGSAYNIYQNAKAAGVGGASLRFLTEKTLKVGFEAADRLTQIVTGQGILDHVEDKSFTTKQPGK